MTTKLQRQCETIRKLALWVSMAAADEQKAQIERSLGNTSAAEKAEADRRICQRAVERTIAELKCLGLDLYPET